MLKPETQRSVILGLRTDALGGRADFDIDVFYVDFRNQPTVATADGIAVQRAIGRQRYRGVDVGWSFTPTTSWTIQANATWNDPRFKDFVTEVDGEPTQLAGNRQVLAPTVRGGAGLIYAPPRGLRGAFTASYTAHATSTPRTAFALAASPSSMRRSAIALTAIPRRCRPTTSRTGATRCSPASSARGSSTD